MKMFKLGNNYINPDRILYIDTLLKEITLEGGISISYAGHNEEFNKLLAYVRGEKMVMD